MVESKSVLFRTLREFGWPLGFISLAIGSAIAALAPFDVGFDFVTGRSAAVRALELPAIGLIGLFRGGRVGLTVPAVVNTGRRPIWESPWTVTLVTERQRGCS